MEPQGLSSVRVRFVKGHPVGQRLELASVDMRLELVAGLVVEARLHVDSRDVRVDVHDEHRAAVALEDVQVVDIELAVLARQRRVQMVRH